MFFTLKVFKSFFTTNTGTLLSLKTLSVLDPSGMPSFLRYEIERVKSSQKNSSIGLLRPGITSDIENDLGHQYQKLIEEISAFVVNNTTSSYILSRSVNSFFVLMPETPVDKCNLTMEKMKKSLKTLLENNVKEHKIEVHSSVREITPNSEYQSVLNDLRAGILKD